MAKIERMHARFNVILYEKVLKYINKELYISAYEQAFQLSSNDSQKSNVKAALGMLGYMLGDIDVSKQVLFNR